MIPALAPLFIADFQHYRNVLVLPDDPRPGVPLRTILTGDGLSDVLTRFGSAYPPSDPRGLASLWSKHYLIKLIPPVVAASLILNHRLPLHLDHLQLILDDNALPAAFKLPHSGQQWLPAPVDSFERFDDLLEQHLRPFIDAIARHVHLSPKVLWSNAGNYFEWLLGVLANAMPHADVRHGHQLLNARHLSDGRRNPLYQPVRYINLDGQDKPKRERRVCCIRYRVDGLDYCSNCPLS
ncbi:siderophore-iron reductase FhuF [Pseudomonas graminis]|uniref:siderophore-iron reductase FhuF n=1 Tax=Pseudomonas graminis TaxID=158627 RepID=UPI00234BFA57|nr:siderophore-iron reductase FhuF [Pseudomonas graminis]MDC6378627.1 siderophore-iron reductase FhuF [Pseudomonas graminis]